MRRVSDVSGEATRLLLVDDEEDLLAILAAELADLGYQVALATSGREALSLAADRHFDAVITDYKMPEMDGLTMLAQLHALKPDMRGILMTGFVTREALATLQGSGWSYLTKPFEIGELVVLLDRELKSAPSGA